MTYSEKLRHPKWQKKRLEILNRDEFTCKMCGDTETELHIHHLNYENNNDPWNVSNENLITYCKVCHLVVEDFKKIDGVEILGIHLESYTKVPSIHFIAANYLGEHILFGINYSDDNYDLICSIPVGNIQKIINMFNNGQNKG